MPINLVDYARIEWRKEDQNNTNKENTHISGYVPYAIDFDDIYFSGRGPEETQHVFIDANYLPNRFQSEKKIVIGEAGFGTGLNFLTTWQSWQKQKRQDGATLHFLSFEKYPLHPEDMYKAHQAWPELASLAKQLRNNLPANLTGFHHITLSPDVTLTLYYGDIADGLRALTSTTKIDVWFLDGFSPNTNQQMWETSLFHLLANHTQKGATASTFTVAGNVRRGLQDAGFTVEKTPGFGRKRHMIRATFNKETTKVTNNKFGLAPCLSTQKLSPLAPKSRIAIIGGGIAGGALAYALRQAGLHPTIFEAISIASGASGNDAGLIMPRLDRDHSPVAHFYLHAFLYTTRLLEYLQQQNPDIPLFNPCGATIETTDLVEIKKLHEVEQSAFLPDQCIRKTDSGLFFPQGGTVNPPQFVRALIDNTHIHKTAIKQISSYKNYVQLKDYNNNHHEFDAVIIANSVDALRFIQARNLPLAASLGQIDIYPDAKTPNHATSYGPYYGPLPDINKTKGIVIGATYSPWPTPAPLKAHTLHPHLEATEENLQKLQAHAPDLGQSLITKNAKSRARLRCVTPDQHPVAGPVPDWGFYGAAYDGLRFGKSGPFEHAHYQTGIFIMTGLGSRGLVTAPLTAALIAAQIAGTPTPVSQEIEKILHPGRFFIRSLKRAKAHCS